MITSVNWKLKKDREMHTLLSNAPHSVLTIISPPGAVAAEEFPNFVILETSSTQAPFVPVPNIAPRCVYRDRPFGSEVNLRT